MDWGSHLICPLIHHDYPVIERGEGIYLYDDQGKKYIDGCSGAVVSSIGHGVEEIARAMAQQARKLAFVHRFHFSNPEAQKLAREVSALAPPSLNRCLFAGSGSEAVELAMKVARQYFVELGEPERDLFVSRFTSYHGSTLGALSLSGHTARRQLMEPLLHHYPAVPPPYCYRCFGALSYPECDLACALELESALIRAPSGKVAALFLEPIIGASGGVIVPPEGYLKRVREICDRHGILLVADEVMTGFGRTGKNFAVDHWEVSPDLMALGKGIAAGYANLSGLLVSDKVFEVIEQASGKFMAGHTFSNNPLSAATGVAVLRYMRDQDLVRRSGVLGSQLGKELKNLYAQEESVGDVRGLGLFWGIEFVRDRASRTPFTRQKGFTGRLVSECMDRGLVIYPADGGGADGHSGDAVILAPPLTINQDQISQMVSILQEALAQVRAGLS